MLAVAKYPLATPWRPAEVGLVEYVASKCAHVFGVEAPEPFLLKPDEDVVNELHRRFGLEVQRTYGFASQHLSGLRVLDDFLAPDAIFNFRHLLADELASEAPNDHSLEVAGWAISSLVHLYCFDLLALNSDRLPENPNSAVKLGGGIVAFDFGACLFTHGSSVRSIESSMSRSQICQRVEIHLLANPLREVLRTQWGAECVAKCGESLRNNLPTVIDEFRKISHEVRRQVQDETSKEIAGFFSLFDHYLSFMETDADRIVETALHALGS